MEPAEEISPVEPPIQIDVRQSVLKTEETEEQSEDDGHQPIVYDAEQELKEHFLKNNVNVQIKKIERAKAQEVDDDDEMPMTDMPVSF